MYKVALLLFSLAGSLLPSMTAAAAPKWVKCTFNQGGPPDAAPESQTPKDVIAVLNDDAKGFSEYGSLNQLLRPCTILQPFDSANVNAMCSEGRHIHINQTSGQAEIYQGSPGKVIRIESGSCSLIDPMPVAR